jgi:hypothetical protein
LESRGTSECLYHRRSRRRFVLFVSAACFFTLVPDAERFRFLYDEKMDGNWRQCPRHSALSLLSYYISLDSKLLSTLD